MRSLSRFAIAPALVGVLAAPLAGCGGSSTSSAGGSPGLVSPTAFETAMAEPDRVTINVHVPDEGSIEGTDLSIPFDQIEARQSELPDTSTPLAVYCHSGNMSAEAVQTLTRLGYSDVVELEGGMIAWEESGRTLLPPGSGTS
jgi:phage shock protein E